MLLSFAAFSLELFRIYSQFIDLFSDNITSHSLDELTFSLWRWLWTWIITEPYEALTSPKLALSLFKSYYSAPSERFISSIVLLQHLANMVTPIETFFFFDWPSLYIILHIFSNIQWYILGVFGMVLVPSRVYNEVLSDWTTFCCAALLYNGWPFGRSVGLMRWEPSKLTILFAKYKLFFF